MDARRKPKPPQQQPPDGTQHAPLGTDASATVTKLQRRHPVGSAHTDHRDIPRRAGAADAKPAAERAQLGHGRRLGRQQRQVDLCAPDGALPASTPAGAQGQRGVEVPDGEREEVQRGVVDELGG